MSSLSVAIFAGFCVDSVMNNMFLATIVDAREFFRVRDSYFHRLWRMLVFILISGCGLISLSPPHFLVCAPAHSWRIGYFGWNWLPLIVVPSPQRRGTPQSFETRSP